MLDISIKALDKAITSKKKASDFIKKHVKVVEKIDGTKLTLIRNDEPFDPDDYTKNWIVSYKGRIVYPTEFECLEDRDQEIRLESIGTAQYKFVHDHLKKIHHRAENIPESTEFFIEFVQNKPTITRDYEIKHGMFLVGFGSANYVTSRGHIYSNSTFESTPKLIEKFSSILELGRFPVVFEGAFSSPEEIRKGCTNPSVKEMFQSNLGVTDFTDPLSVVALVVSVFSRLQSVLGGPAEGVVLQASGEDFTAQSLYKVLTPDQHSKEVRAEKKSRFLASSDEDEASYKHEVTQFARGFVNQILESDLNEMFKELSRLVYGMKYVPNHSVKSRINVQEDIFLQAKMGILYSGTNDAQNIAIIPMAAKPFHRGHDSLISQAIADGNEAAIVFLSTGGREEISSKDMISLWRHVYLPGINRIYGNKVSIMFSDSPMTDAMKFARNFAREARKDVAVYGGIGEDGTNEAQSRVDLVLSKNPELADKITAAGVDRSLTGNISGSKMRELLLSLSYYSFIENLPAWMDKKERDIVWFSLSRGKNLDRNI